MKKYLLVLFLFQGLIAIAQDMGLRCAFDVQTPDIEAKLERAKQTKKFLQQSGLAAIRDKIVIPIVVHVLFTREEERLSEQAILSQIQVLNEDFNALNEDTHLIPLEFRDLKADIGFTFCLAQKDPQGQHSKGIVYHHTEVDCIANTLDVKGANNRAAIFYTDYGGADAWDPDRYLNIWVGNSCGRFLGHTPSYNPLFAQEDGVVIDYHFFGSGCTAYPFDKGRTTTHEVGHYFGLNHIFSGADCDDDDGIEDTPQQAHSYSGCPSYPQSSCGSRDMFMNFMDYVDDACMRLFTKGQKDWMLATLMVHRAGLMANGDEVCMTDTPVQEEVIEVFPNPVQHCIYASIREGQVEGAIEVQLFNASGVLVYESKTNTAFINPILVTHFPKGIYFLRFQYNGGELQTKKVLIH